MTRTRATPADVKRMWLRLWGKLSPAIVWQLYKITDGKLLDKTQK